MQLSGTSTPCSHWRKRYLENPAQYGARALAEPTLKGVVRALFENTVEFLTLPSIRPTLYHWRVDGLQRDATPAGSHA